MQRSHRQRQEEAHQEPLPRGRSWNGQIRLNCLAAVLSHVTFPGETSLFAAFMGLVDAQTQEFVLFL